MVDGNRPAAADRGSPALLVSACLVGRRCNYKAQASPTLAIDELGERFRIVPVCPEVEGGLPVPRPAAEITSDGRVCTVDGDDLTAEFRAGAEVAVSLARRNDVVGAVLKARSPSCGSAQIYDGTFTRTLVPGDGLTAAALRAAGYEVVTEEDVAEGRVPGGRR